MSEFNESNLNGIIALLTKASDNVKDVFAAGKQSERDAFWDAFQTPSRRLWYGAFQNACWNDTTFYPKYDITSTGDASSLFRYCDITDLEGRLNECGVTLDTSEATSLNCAFGESKITALPTINLSKCISAARDSHGVFGGCKDLISIRKVIVNEAVALSNTFTTCNSLQNIDFEGFIGQDINLKWSTKLTDESIESIINHLSDTAEEKTLTLSETAVDEAFRGFGCDPNTGTYGDEVDGQYADNWISLYLTKTNWTITLV